MKQKMLTMLSNICLAICKPILTIGNFFYNKHVDYLHASQRLDGLR